MDGTRTAPAEPGGVRVGRQRKALRTRASAGVPGTNPDSRTLPEP